MKSLSLASAAVLMISAASCERDAVPEPSEVETTGAPLPSACPSDLPNTTMTMSDTPDGIALTYTTTGDVSGVRGRAAAMATRIDALSGTAMHHMRGRGGYGPGHGMGLRTGMLPASNARVEEISGGARIVLTPEDPAQLGDLRAHMRHHESMMGPGQGQCPWLVDDRGAPRRR